MYVYLSSEPSLWTVGFYSPDGEWYAESDHKSAKAAAERVHYLNGGKDEAEEINDMLQTHQEMIERHRRVYGE